MPDNPPVHPSKESVEAAQFFLSNHRATHNRELSAQYLSLVIECAYRRGRESMMEEAVSSIRELVKGWDVSSNDDRTIQSNDGEYCIDAIRSLPLTPEKKL